MEFLSKYWSQVLLLVSIVGFFIREKWQMNLKKKTLIFEHQYKAKQEAKARFLIANEQYLFAINDYGGRFILDKIADEYDDHISPLILELHSLILILKLYITLEMHQGLRTILAGFNELKMDMYKLKDQSSMNSQDKFVTFRKLYLDHSSRNEKIINEFLENDK